MATLRNATAAMILSLWSFSCAAQDFKGQPEQCGSCPPTKVSEVLTHHGIALTEEALVLALRSDDEKIRGMAASQLEIEGARNAIPAIVDALQAERAPAQRVYIAEALAEMKDDRGIQALRLDCNDSNLPITYRLASARYLAMFQDDRSCWKVVAEAAQFKDDPGTRAQALSMVPDFKRSSAEQFAVLHALLLNGLRDEDPMVRMQTGNILETMGDVSAIPALQTAITAEGDAQVRDALEDDLSRLQKKQHYPRDGVAVDKEVYNEGP